MKKFTAILLAVIVIFSAMSMMVFAEEGTATVSTGDFTKFTCEFCGTEFEKQDAYTAHIKAYFPEPGHAHTCGHKLADGTTCTQVFYTREAYDAHCTVCKEADDMDKAKLAFKEGDYLNAIKYFFNVVVEFVKGDTFKSITGTVSDIAGKIDFNKIINAVKDLFGKIPFDKIGDLFA